MPAKKPPPPPPGHRPPPHARARSLSFVDAAAIDAALAGLIPDARDRALVLRCILEEGPAHHRGANFVLLRLLAERAGRPVPSAVDDSVPVPMRLPPHLAAHDDAAYGLRLPLAPLRRIAGSDADVEAMAACLTDGPPQHALANVLMVCLIDALSTSEAG